MRYLTDDAVLDAVLSSPWERGAAESQAMLEIEVEVSAAIDLLSDDAFEDVPAERTIRVATDLSWCLS